MSDVQTTNVPAEGQKYNAGISYTNVKKLIDRVVKLREQHIPVHLQDCSDNTVQFYPDREESSEPLSDTFYHIASAMAWLDGLAVGENRGFEAGHAHAKASINATIPHRVIIMQCGTQFFVDIEEHGQRQQYDHPDLPAFSRARALAACADLLDGGELVIDFEKRT